MSNVSSTGDDVLASARTLIMAGGYDGFSYAHIADGLRMRKPSNHRHFASKVGRREQAKKIRAALSICPVPIRLPPDRPYGRPP